MSMLSNLRRKAATEPPQEPRFEDPNPRLSHKAAIVAQEMEALETELAAATARAQAQENRAKVAEGQLEHFRTMLVEVTHERDTVTRERDVIVAKLQASASIILDALRARPPQARAEEAGLEAVAGTVDSPLAEHDDEHPIMPAFLRNGPAEEER
jgi:hypothetical protein